MADNKSCEVIREIRKEEFKYNLMDVTDLQIKAIIELYEKHRKKHVSLDVDIDCSNAIKGLKAVQREARKATAELKKLESLMKMKGKFPGKIKAYGIKPNTAIYDEFQCPKCNGYNFEETTLRTLEQEDVSIRLDCLDCGWSNV